LEKQRESIGWLGAIWMPGELAAEHRAHFIKRSVNKVKRETAATTAATMVIPMAHAILPGIPNPLTPLFTPKNHHPPGFLLRVCNKT